MDELAKQNPNLTITHYEGPFKTFVIDETTGKRLETISMEGEVFIAECGCECKWLSPEQVNLIKSYLMAKWGLL